MATATSGATAPVFTKHRRPAPLPTPVDPWAQPADPPAPLTTAERTEWVTVEWLRTVS